MPPQRKMEVNVIQKYPHIFTPYQIGNIRLKNRIFTAPTTRHTLQDNLTAFSEGSFAYYINKAKGGSALITIGAVLMDINPPASRFSPIYDLSNKLTRRAFRNLTNAIHTYDARVTLELLYLGPQRHTKKSAENKLIYGVCNDTLKNGVVTAEIPEEVMYELAEGYAQNALYAKECGFDGILLHGGHGMFLEQFLSPLYNKRTDQYGGSLENRARFPKLIVDRIREKVGRDFLIEYRISGSERVEGGFDLEECISYIKMIQDRIDLIHVSAGDSQTSHTRAVMHPSGFLPEAPNAYLAAAVKQSGIRIPVVTIGSFQDPETIEQTLAAGRADFVTIARGHIADPATVSKAYEGRREEIRPCIKCFRCLDDEKTKEVFHCSVNPWIGREHLLPKMIAEASRPKKIIIAGGGPAGMEAAIVSAERGHEVILLEQGDKLGGKLNFSQHVEFKYDLQKFVQYLIRTVKKMKIEVRLNTTATRELLEQENPDHVIAAIGARPVVPDIPGLYNARIMPAEEIYGKEDSLEKKIVVIGGGQVGCETALHLAQCNKQVRLLEKGEVLAADAVHTYRIPLLERLETSVSCITGANVLEIRNGRVLYQDDNGEEAAAEGELIVLAAGYKEKADEADALFSHSYGFRIIGDAARVGSVENAIRTGFEAGIVL